jgi:glycosyltransferase involved in cell wall biosynthesis
VAVIPNGVAAAESAEVPPAESARRAAAFRAAHALPGTAKVLLFIGRINPKKRLEDIIAAFAELAPREPDLHLVLAGQADDAYLRALRGLVDRTGLSARVRWVGFLDEAGQAGGLRRRRLFRPCVRLGGHGLGDP